MSIAKFEDFDKGVNDAIKDDFDSKFSLKVKSAGPFGVTVTTNTTYNPKDNKLAVKLTGKYPHSSGFTVEKLEISPDGKVVTETSLKGAAPGLVLEFKANDSDKGDLSAIYSIPSATFTGEIDALSFSKASASVNSVHGPYSAGGAVNLSIAKKSITSSLFDFGVGFTVPKSAFVGLRLANNFKDVKGNFSFVAYPNLTLLGLVNYSSKKVSSTFGASYKCNKDTTIKVKAASSGVINASVKQDFEKKFSVVGSVEIGSGLKSAKFGVNAVLG